MRSRCKTVAIVSLSVVLLLFSHLGQCKKQKLEITTESKPDDCLKGAENGDELVIHYTGTFTSGKVFDTSKQRDPFTIRLGSGQVIPGWEQGLVGMCEGEVRKLKIPPHLAYGDRGVEGVIPGGATLIFTIELLALNKPSMVTFNRDTLSLIAVVVLVGMIGVEVFRRYKKEGETIKESKRTKKGHKKRK